MRFPVEIMITNKKLSYRDMITPGDIPEPHESVESFEGYMNVKGKRLTIDYKEYFDDGEIADTSVMLEDDLALISRRSDEMITNLVFRQGAVYDCVCYNGYRNMNLRVSTRRMKSDMSAIGGKLNIDYTIEILGNLAETNSICVSVCPTDSVS